MTFLKTAEDTGGEYVRIELAVRPHGFVAAPHIHPRQEESFEIHQGTFTFVFDGEERQVGPGKGATVPPGTPHAWWNPGDEPGLATVEIRPALKAEEFFETMFGLAQDGKVSPKTGLPNLLWIAALTARCSDSEPMRTWAHERLRRRPKTKDSLLSRRRHVQGPGSPHLLRESLLGQALRQQGTAGRIASP